jgi:hypothetical protein
MSDVSFASNNADDKGVRSLDLSKVDNAVVIDIDNGQGVFGADVAGLTGSGATLVCEMNLGGAWRNANMLVNGSNGAFINSITADSTFRANASARWQVRMRVTVAGTGVATVSYSLTTNSSLTQITSPLPPGPNAIGSITNTGFNVTGTLPAFAVPPSVMQSGAWTVSLSGSSANIPVSGTVAATQSGAWSVAVGNFPTSQAVTGKFWQDTQPISGTVGISGTVPVSGTFWQATQPISAASLPLPAGAATASGVAAVVTALGSPLQAGGAVSVSNFPASQAVTGTFWQATQPVSAASLPLPSGAATAAKQDAIVTALAPQATAAKQDSIIAALGGRLIVTDYRVPNPDAAGAVTPKVTTAVSSFVASTVPCNFFGAAVIGRNDGTAGVYVYMLNRTTVPASGATINMTEVMAMTGYSAGGGASLVPDQVPDRYTAGCVVILTATIDTYTPVTGVNLPKYIKVRVL